jgi:hypothetical protein
VTVRFLTTLEALTQADAFDHDGATVVTDDRWLREGGVMHEADHALIRSVVDAEKVERKGGKSEGTMKMTKQDFETLSRDAIKLHRAFEKIAGKLMVPSRALMIRDWRVQEHCTWRTIAQRAHDTFGRDVWRPASNQLMGMALCGSAARLFHEDHLKEPWN